MVTRETQRPISQRHRQVIDGLARGLTKQEIADELGIHVGTVKFHCNEARWILGVSKARKLPEALRAYDSETAASASVRGGGES